MKPTEKTETHTVDVEDDISGVGETLPETMNLSLPKSATQSEAAAIAAAVGAHLHDCSVARTSTDDSNPYDRWKLAGRLGDRDPPRKVVYGDEWKAAARSR